MFAAWSKRIVQGLASRGQSNRVARGPASPAQSNSFVRGLTSLAESNSDVGSLNLHDWCFRLAWQAPSLYGASEGSASEAADVRLGSFGLSIALSAAAESAFPEGAMASILTSASSVELRDASGGERASRAG